MQITSTTTVIPWRFSLKWVIKKNYFWRPIYSYSSIFENNKKPYLLNEIIQFLWCVFLPILSPTTIIPWRFFLNALYHIVYFIKVNKCYWIKWSCNFLQMISWCPPPPVVRSSLWGLPSSLPSTNHNDQTSKLRMSSIIHHINYN